MWNFIYSGKTSGEYRRVLLWCFLLSFSNLLFAQKDAALLLNKKVKVSLHTATLSEALVLLSEQTETNILFSPDFADMQTRVDYSREATLDVILRDLLSETRLDFEEHGQSVILSRDLNHYTISGYAVDEESGERLVGAHVFDLLSGKGAISNRYGYFSLTLQADSVQLRSSYLGYAQQSKAFFLKQNYNVEIRLEKSNTLQEVHVRAPRFVDSEVIMPIEINFIDREAMDNSVRLGGEEDLHRYLESLPGINSGADGVGGLSVRGGSSDQNLILMDGVPVYNPSHAIGLFSVFNPKMIREVDLRKGQFPAQYGGRLSSVIDVHTKEGNLQDWHLDASISPVSGNILVEGPIKENKSSILVAARRFLPDFLVQDISEKQKKEDGYLGNTDFLFYDLNVKWQTILSDKDKVYLSMYLGEDKFYDYTRENIRDSTFNGREEFEKEIRWGNGIGIMRWNHQFMPRLFLNTTVTFSRFGLQSYDKRDLNGVLLPSLFRLDSYDSREFKSEIIDVGIKFDFDHPTIANNVLQYGASIIKHEFRPKSYSYNEESQIEEFLINDGLLDDALFTGLYITALEYSGYFNGKWTLGKKWYLETGMRLGAFSVQDKTYLYAEPRLHASYQLMDALTLRLNASRMVQPLHLLTTNGIGLPTDLWVPATSEVRPQQAYQTSGAINFKKGGWTAEIGGFYKSLHNLISYKEGASFLIGGGSIETSLIDAANWENKITTGKGEAYGLEGQVGYKNDDLRFDVSYSYGKSMRKFEEINFGREFPFRFDRRQSITLNGVYHFSPSLTMSSNWTFGTGLPITLAESKFTSPASTLPFSSVVALQFTERNGYRLPNYHRLNIGLQWSKKRPSAEHVINLDVYNVYNRKNPFYYTLMEDERTGRFESKQFSVVGILPSISYTLKL